MKAPYKFRIGVLDTKTDKVIFDVKGLSFEQLKVVFEELKLKYR